MSPLRRWIVFALLAIIGIGHLYDTLTGIEHWPFSPYPMYASAEAGPEMMDVRLVGVKNDPASTELDLLQSSAFPPLSGHELLALLRSADLSARRGDPSHLAILMHDCLNYYTTRQPDLASLRLYEWHWATDRWARNALTPNQKTLIYEARAMANSPE
jgi:hypothetical protein